MHDTSKNIGEKIRELRLKKRMTQRELAGDKITRNMLSLIESGNASPSIPTLMYISDRLGTPIAYFFSSTEKDVAVFSKMAIMDELKSCFKMKKYSDCQAISSTIPEYAIDDEISYIIAVSYIFSAIEKAALINVKDAMADLHTASHFSKRSIYCEGKVFSSIEYLREVLANICSENVTDMMCDFSYCSDFVPAQMIEYFSSIRSISRGENAPFEFPKGSHAERHIYALNLMAEDRVTEAQKRLRELSLNPETPYYMQYRVLSDLENAANISGDFKLAYSSSRRKIEFLKQNKI